MSPSQSIFSWISFLLGFAIALWVALVVLFILPDDDAPVAACPSCCCHGPMWPYPRPISDWPLYIPSGNEPYTCANNDNGGGVVQDNGGGIVQDNGGGIVQDGTPQVPAPTDDTLGTEDGRDQEEFKCGTNDNGGGIVQDAETLRRVVVPMREDSTLYCAEISGHATVLRQVGAEFRPISYDSGGNAIERPNTISNVTNRVQYPNDPADPGWAFCSVASKDDLDPVIVNEKNECIAKQGNC